MLILPCCRPAHLKISFLLVAPWLNFGGVIFQLPSLDAAQELILCQSDVPGLQMSSASGTHCASPSCCLQMFSKCSPVRRPWKNPAATSRDNGWLQFASCHPRWIMDLAKHKLEGSSLHTKQIGGHSNIQKMLALASNLLCSQTTPGEHHVGTLKEKFTTQLHVRTALVFSVLKPVASLVQSWDEAQHSAPPGAAAQPGTAHNRAGHPSAAAPH